jgi:adenylate kinase
MMRLILFIGPPGSGKGTQAQRLAQELGYRHLVMGDLLREEIRAKTPLGQKIQPLLEAGLLVPDELVIDLVAHHLQNGADYILDGFPRTVPQAQALDRLLNEKGASLQSVIFLDVPEEELIVRLLKRSELEGRTDDNPETIQRRLAEYRQKTQPLLDFYEARGLLRRISGVGSIPQITERIKKAMEMC